MRAIAIDFETANEQRASPCAVGLAWIEDGIVTRTAYRLIRPPQMRFAPGNVRIHGIRPRDVEGASEFPAVLDEFLADLSGTLLLAHNAAFDMGVITASAAHYGRRIPALRYACTRWIGKRAWPGEPSHGLAALARRAGIAFRHHHAEEDAFACAKVALAAATESGTDRIAVLLDRLAIAPRRTVAARSWVGRSPSPPEPAIRLRPNGPVDDLVFQVAGGSGARYEVRGSFAKGGYRLSCGCMAGIHRRRCRHVTSLLDGEVSDLLSDNLHDLAKLGAIVQALGPDAIEPRGQTGRVASASQAAVSGSTSGESAVLTQAW